MSHRGQSTGQARTPAGRSAAPAQLQDLLPLCLSVTAILGAVGCQTSLVWGGSGRLNLQVPDGMQAGAWGPIPSLATASLVSGACQNPHQASTTRTQVRRLHLQASIMRFKGTHQIQHLSAGTAIGAAQDALHLTHILHCPQASTVSALRALDDWHWQACVFFVVPSQALE